MRRRTGVTLAALAVLSLALVWAPSPARVAEDAPRSCRARVLSTDDSRIELTGLVEYGTQHLEVELLDGPEKGRRLPAENELRAQLDIDKKFSVGDIALVTAPVSGSSKLKSANQTIALTARDHWRLGWMAVLFGAFCLLLVVFGGGTGAKALLSFVFSCLAVWRVLVPLCLNGHSASLVSFGVVALLTAVIMLLVAGATRKGLTAFLGASLGVGASLALAQFFSAALHVNGATMPYVQALLYSGYESLDLPDLFTGSVILASSGAVMDLAMDIAAACEEVVRHRPDVTRRELFRSGLRVGRSVVGTMTTTLLLAYSGGYLTLLMVFAAQGTPPLDFLNSTLVSAEIVKTLVGSFGLVLVAPFTAAIAAVNAGHARDPGLASAASAARAEESLL